MEAVSPIRVLLPASHLGHGPPLPAHACDMTQHVGGQPGQHMLQHLVRQELLNGSQLDLHLRLFMLLLLCRRVNLWL